jgi:outer membrane protein assembly factor BamE (lipoprotein component of BamABCDE complex)
MPRKLKGWGLAVLMVLLVAAAACNTADKQAAEEQAQRDAEWSELLQKKDELDAARGELAELEASVGAEDEEGAMDEGAMDEGAMDDTMEEGEAVADPAARIEELQTSVDEKSEEFNNALVAFINANPLVEGEEPTERQKEAIRMKSDEDLLVAQEYIDMGGNYQRAIDIYNAALMVDPDNEKLQAALEDAQAKRYMDEERFGQIKNGMTEDEVRAILGTPNRANVREFPEERVVAWFYPVSAQGSAAAVWFRARREGDTYKVYKSNFEEVVKEGPTVVGEGEEDDS